MQSPNLVVAHAVVLGQDDLHGVTANLDLPAQPVHDIAQASGLRSRGAFSGYHHDVHRTLANPFAASCR
jgi:hypothetical protein